MPVKRDQPFSDDYPIKGGLIVFGQKRPGSSKKADGEKPQTGEEVPEEEPEQVK
jgi:hypothetical protein